VMRMRGHDALSSGGEEEATLPQVPVRDAQPPIRLVVRLIGQAGIVPVGSPRSFGEATRPPPEQV
jgi:hypothetical protein